jgi:hypothetical protein
MTILKLRSRPSLIISQFVFLALSACSDGELLNAFSSSSTDSKQVSNVVNTPSSTATASTATSNTAVTSAAKVATATATTPTTTTAPSKTTNSTSSTSNSAPTPVAARTPAAAPTPLQAPVSTPAPAPVAVATAGATVNSLDVIVNDMALRNDFVLRGYEDKTVGWYVGPGYVVMGNIPNISNAPQDFQANNPNLAGLQLKAILPLVVLFDGTANSATNTRAEMRNIQLIIKSKSTKQWRVIGVSAGLGGFNTPKTTLFNGSVPEDKRTNADGSVQIKPPSDSRLTWHGWWNNGRTLIDSYDVEAVMITMQARLTVDNPSLPDDRDHAQLGIQIGADYYIDQNTSWQSINPAAMLSRTKRITKDWQAFNAMTFSNVGIQEPGGGITEASFRAAPPPLQ